MRSLNADLETTQKSSSFVPLWQIQLTLDGNDDTFVSSNIPQIRHVEEPYHQQAEVVIFGVQADRKGYKGVISYGATTPGSGDQLSPTAPMWVTGQQVHSSRGILTTTLTLKGIPDFLNMDKASDKYVQTSADLKTIKDMLKELAAGKLDDWANATAYSLGDLVVPATQNDFIYRVTSAGTSGGSEPTFPTTIGNTVVDNGVTWTCIGKEITQFSHTNAYTITFDSEDSLLDVFTPGAVFGFGVNYSRLNAIQDLLVHTKCVFRTEDDEAIHIRVPTLEGPDWGAGTAYSLNDYVRDPTSPANNFAFRCTTAGTTGGSEPAWPTTAGATVSDGGVVWTAIDFDYEYKVNVSGEHEIWNKVNRTRLVLPNRIEVRSEPELDAGFSGSAEDTDSSGITNRRVSEFRYLESAVSDAQCAILARAILQGFQLDAQRGSASVPINVGQEVHDFVKFTDSRAGDIRIGNVGSIQRRVESGRWEMQIAFGSVEAGGYIGLFEDAWAGQTAAVSPVVPGIGDDIAGGATAQDLAVLANQISHLSSQIQQMQSGLEQLQSLSLTTFQWVDTIAQRLAAHILQDDGGIAPPDTTSSPHTVQGNAPEYRLEETDQTDPAGRYRLIVAGNVFSIDRQLTVGWASRRQIYTYNVGGNVAGMTAQEGDDWHFEISAGNTTQNQSRLKVGGSTSSFPGFQIITGDGSGSALARLIIGIGSAAVEATWNRVNIFQFNQNMSFLNSAGVFIFQNNTDGASIEVMRHSGPNRGTAVTNDEAFIRHTLDSDDEKQGEFARVTWKGTDITNTAEFGDYILSVAINGVMTELLKLDGSQGSVNFAKYIHPSVTASITASTNQSQGQGALISEINEVATVGNDNDVVTLPVAFTGRRVVIFNNGIHRLQIFPASGDDLGQGVDNPDTLAVSFNLSYQAYDDTNWFVEVAPLGSVHPLDATYSGDASGTSGSDNTAQTVKTITIPANSMEQPGDRLRVRTYWTGDTGGPITGTTTLNGVTIAAAIDGGAADFFTTEAWLHYIDNTHATIIETGAYPATGATSAPNVAGFDWSTTQDVDLDQDAVSGNHIIVFFMAVDVFPKGIR